MPLQYTAVSKQHFSCNHKILAIPTNAKQYKNYFVNDPQNPTNKRHIKIITSQQITKLHNYSTIVFTSHNQLTFTAPYLNIQLCPTSLYHIFIHYLMNGAILIKKLN